MWAGPQKCFALFDRNSTTNPGGIGVRRLFWAAGLNPISLSKKNRLLRPYALPKQPLETNTTLAWPAYLCMIRTILGMGLPWRASVIVSEQKSYCNLAKLPVIWRTWEDLASPAGVWLVGSLDPRKSGSVHAVYEIILQAYGWEKGWRTITGLGANVRNFTNCGEPGS